LNQKTALNEKRKGLFELLFDGTKNAPEKEYNNAVFSVTSAENGLSPGVLDNAKKHLTNEDGKENVNEPAQDDKPVQDDKLKLDDKKNKGVVSSVLNALYSVGDVFENDSLNEQPKEDVNDDEDNLPIENQDEVKNEEVKDLEDVLESNDDDDEDEVEDIDSFKKSLPKIINIKVIIQKELDVLRKLR
jgi:hypothetical protein